MCDNWNPGQKGSLGSWVYTCVWDVSCDGFKKDHCAILLSNGKPEESGTPEWALSIVVPSVAWASLPPQVTLDPQSAWDSPAPWVREEGNSRIFWSTDGDWSVGLKKLHLPSSFTVGTAGTKDRSPRRKACQVCFKMFCMTLNLQKWRFWSVGETGKLCRWTGIWLCGNTLREPQ